MVCRQEPLSLEFTYTGACVGGIRSDQVSISTDLVRMGGGGVVGGGGGKRLLFVYLSIVHTNPLYTLSNLKKSFLV